MSIRLVFDVDIDEAGMAQFYAEYPGFLEDGEEPVDTLAREAIAQWDIEGLLKDARFVKAEQSPEVLA